MRKRFWALVVLLVAGGLETVTAQTPSPLQEWQYSGGIILARLFEPNLPTFRTVLGIAAQGQPIYSSSRAYRVQGGPAIDIRYRDVAFISSGDGIGYNVLRGDHYQLGLAVAYDLGRNAREFIGGAQGAVAEASFFLPLPGSSRTFVMFAGPSITVATRHYLQTASLSGDSVWRDITALVGLRSSDT